MEKSEEEPKQKRELTEKQKEQRTSALIKAVAKKKELAELRRIEKEKSKIEIEKKIREPQPSTPPEEVIPEKKKKKTRIIERVVEEPESSSSEEEIIERVIVKKIPRQQIKPKNEDDNIHEIIEKTNKEILMERLKEAQKKKAMAELFNF